MTARTKDLSVAIQQHASRGSEANTVINNYNMLSQTDQQSLLNYLRHYKACCVTMRISL